MAEYIHRGGNCRSSSGTLAVRRVRWHYGQVGGIARRIFGGAVRGHETDPPGLRRPTGGVGVRIGHAALSIGVLLMSGSAASAEDVCAQLRALLKDPPSGFVSLRGERTSTTWPRWSGKPFLPNSACEITGSDDGPDSQLRCTVNDKAEPAVADEFYETTQRAIDQCLPGLPNGREFVRKEVPKAADGFKGNVTSWVYRSQSMRFEIELS